MVSSISNSKNLTSVICLHQFKWIYIYDLKVNSLLLISFLNELKLIGLHINIAIVSTQLKVFNYCDQTTIFLFNINHLFSLSEVVSSIAI